MRLASFVDATIALQKLATKTGTTYLPGTCARCLQTKPVFDVGDEKMCQSCCMAIVEPKGEPVVIGPVVGRNDPCPCGSGKKHKKCHGATK